ncbi:MAG: hypothetical protein QM802_03235 [Agriterribacter sp.]
MKKLLYVIAGIVILVLSCSKKTPQESQVTPPEKHDTVSKYKFDTIIKAPATEISSGIVLPTGTRLQLSADELVMYITLPEGYGFLTDDTSALAVSAKPLPVINYTSYSCKCSGGSGACKVFYQELAGGFGCLHSTCAGSCIGSFTSAAARVRGVIITDQDRISSSHRASDPIASFLSGTKGSFFDLPAVQQQIEEQYNNMYRGTSMPDFNAISQHLDAYPEYVYVKMWLYGVPFYLIGPSKLSQRTDVFTVAPLKSSCKCSGSGSCTRRSGGVSKFSAIWCDGQCSDCELTITADPK